MSWTLDEDLFLEFELQADRNIEGTHSFLLDIWGQTSNTPNGAWIKGVRDTAFIESPSTGLRIIFAPLDIPHMETKKPFVRLFRAVGVPTSFIRERLQSVSHSFGNISGPSGSCTWFHFLCKRIDLDRVSSSRVGAPEVLFHEGASYRPQGGARARALPQADYSYDRSGYFLHTSDAGAVTLCCFGASGSVRSRLERFLTSGDWKQAIEEPYILLDLVLEGLYLQLDENVWNINAVFGEAENRLLLTSTSAQDQTGLRERRFAELHNLAKHITHLREAAESCLFLADEVISRVAPGPLSLSPPHLQPSARTPGILRRQVHDTLRYRCTLFRSTRLRLDSLNQRVANSITLSFNLLTASDSMVLIQQSNFMKIVAAITVIFLPTTAVAAVLGSQLFYSEPNEDAGKWVIRASPLLGDMWAVAIPLTVMVMLSALIWDFRTRRRHRSRGREIK